MTWNKLECSTTRDCSTEDAASVRNQRVASTRSSLAAINSSDRGALDRYSSVEMLGQ